MTTVDTSELRWFFQEDDPRGARLRSWLVAATPADVGSGVVRQSRTDLYLFPCSPLLGVKQRGGGALEHKLRLSSVVLRGDGVIAGRLEDWVKLQGGDVQRFGVPAGARWIAVEKHRSLVLLARSQTPAGEPSAAGCSAELTSLAGTGQATFAFEAFGPDATGRRGMLDLALRRLARELPDLTLRDVESRGYPEWLADWVT